MSLAERIYILNILDDLFTRERQLQHSCCEERTATSRYKCQQWSLQGTAAGSVICHGPRCARLAAMVGANLEPRDVAGKAYQRLARRSARGFARLTVRFLPPNSFSLRARIASFPPLAISTNPKPRSRPVSRSEIRLTRSTVP